MSEQTGHVLGCPRFTNPSAPCMCVWQVTNAPVPTEMASLREIKSRLAAIEQHHADVAIWMTGLETKLDAINARLDKQIDIIGGALQRKQKPRRRK